MAMVLTAQKPTRRNREGEVPEGLPGSTLERGMCGERRRELGRPWRFLSCWKDGREVDARDTVTEPRKGKPGHGGRPDPKRDGRLIGKVTEVGETPMIARESDQPILL